jgi:hypothetical protein
MVQDRRDRATFDLLSFEAPQIARGYPPEVAGRGPLDNRISRLIGHALREARDNGLPRGKIAAAMSEFLGTPISKPMLDKWSSEGSELHRIPLAAFIALIQATGDLDLLGIVTREFGHEAVPAKYRDIIELALIEDHERDVLAQKNKLMAAVRGRR